MAQQDSQPDKTSADNPSKTGESTTDSQTHTRPFGSVETENRKETDAEVKSADGVDTTRKAAEKAVIDKNGSESIRQNPNFEKWVDEAEKQIRQSSEQTQGM